MAISPKQEEQLALEIRRIYVDAETRLLEIIAKQLVGGPDDVTEWQSQKLNQLSALIREAERIANRTSRKVRKEIEKTINLAYIAGNESAVEDLKKALEEVKKGKPIPESIQMSLFPGQENIDFDIESTIQSLSGVNVDAIKALAGATTQTLTATAVPIVRQTGDIYRRVVTEIVGSTLTGVDTRREATQRILNRFAQHGIRTFDGKRTWNIASYSEMATRTAIGQASVQGHINKMTDIGFDLVQVSDHHEECELCRPWEGKILSVSGNNPKYPSLDEAVRDGLFHPNCGHRLNTYFEGLTKPLTKTRDPKGYNQRKRQRELERNIRYWKRRQSLAITPKAKRQADDKVNQWTNEMKLFIADTGRRRKREREQNVRAR